MKKRVTNNRNIFDTIFFTELLQGLGVTLRHFFKKKVTEKYPYKPAVVPERSRGIHYLVEKEEGVTACIGCMMCQKHCPSSCFNIKAEKNEEGKRVVTTYDVDIERCIYCGFCEDVCPVDAVILSTDYKTVNSDRSKFILNIDDLSLRYRQIVNPAKEGDSNE